MGATRIPVGDLSLSLFFLYSLPYPTAVDRFGIWYRFLLLFLSTPSSRGHDRAVSTVGKALDALFFSFFFPHGITLQGFGFTTQSGY